MAGAKAVIYRERSDGPVEHHKRVLSLDAFFSWLAGTATEIRGPDGKIKTVSWGRAWFASPHRQKYSGIEFFPNPDGADATEGYLNLWSGFSVMPALTGGIDKYPTFHDHVMTNICGGRYDYFL
jgi:hypothetical protein